MSIKSYNQFINESKNLSIYPTRQEMDIYMLPLLDTFGVKMSITYYPTYINYPNLYSNYDGSSKRTVGYIFSLGFNHKPIEQILKGVDTILIDELKHISENIKLDYPMLDMYYYFSGTYIYICLLDPKLVDTSRVKNMELKKI